MNPKPLDPNRFTLKLVKELEPKTLKGGNKKRYALFVCPECEKEFVTSIIVAYRSKSCKSCSVRKTNTKHGLSYNRFYHTWLGIIQRCYNKNHWQFRYYGQKGVKIASEWLDNPIAFITYVSRLDNASTPYYSLDRIDNKGNYEPNNLRWTDSYTQAHNSKRGFWGESKYVGVTLQRCNGKWKATLSYKYTKYCLGVYKTEIEAAIAYDKKVEELGLDRKTKNKDKYPEDFKSMDLK